GKIHARAGRLPERVPARWRSACGPARRPKRARGRKRGGCGGRGSWGGGRPQGVRVARDSTGFLLRMVREKQGRGSFLAVSFFPSRRAPARPDSPPEPSGGQAAKDSEPQRRGYAPVCRRLTAVTEGTLRMRSIASS